MTTSPIFVTGYQRSGTTLLGSLIDRHPRISIFVESFFIPRFHYLQPLFWPLSKKVNLDRLANAIISQPSSQRNQLNWSETTSHLITDKTYPGVLDAIMTAWACEKGKERWGDKTPGYISKLHILHRMYPDARFVHIIRDGRDVWLSAKKAGWAHNVSAYAHDWRASIEKAQHYAARRLDGQYLEVRYEELIMEPEQVLTEVMSFLGEDFSRKILQIDQNKGRNKAFTPYAKVNNAIKSDNKFKWKKEMPDREVAAFEGQAGELLKKLRYERKFECVPKEARLSGAVSVLTDRFLRMGSFVKRSSRIGMRALRLRIR